MDIDSASVIAAALAIGLAANASISVNGTRILFNSINDWDATETEIETSEIESFDLSIENGMDEVILTLETVEGQETNDSSQVKIEISGNLLNKEDLFLGDRFTGGRDDLSVLNEVIDNFDSENQVANGNILDLRDGFLSATEDFTGSIFDFSVFPLDMAKIEKIYAYFEEKASNFLGTSHDISVAIPNNEATFSTTLISVREDSDTWFSEQTFEIFDS